MTLYLLDSNTISDLIVRLPLVVYTRFITHLTEEDSMTICDPIYYELLRGMYWRKATQKLATLNSYILPLLTWTPLENADWVQAAHFWSDATSKGRKISDPDLLLAALTYRLDGILVSSDTDYDVLPITRENWRVS